MSDANYEFEDETQDQQQKDPVRAHMRKLEAELKQKNELLAKAAQAEKKLAFLEAGVDTSSKISEYFIKAYDGEMNPDAIRAAAEEANLIPSQKKEIASEQQAWNRISQAQKQGETSEPVVDWNTKISQAKSPDEVMQLLSQARAEAEKY